MKEYVRTFPRWLLVYTNNQYWVLKTVEAIYAAGIIKMWDMRSFYSESNLWRNKYIVKKKGKPDVINASKLIPVLILCAVIYLVCLVVCIMELGAETGKGISRRLSLFLWNKVKPIFTEVKRWMRLSYKAIN